LWIIGYAQYQISLREYILYAFSAPVFIPKRGSFEMAPPPVLIHLVVSSSVFTFQSPADPAHLHDDVRFLLKPIRLVRDLLSAGQ